MDINGNFQKERQKELAGFFRRDKGKYWNIFWKFRQDHGKINWKSRESTWKKIYYECLKDVFCTFWVCVSETSCVHSEWCNNAIVCIVRYGRLKDILEMSRLHQDRDLFFSFIIRIRCTFYIQYILLIPFHHYHFSTVLPLSEMLKFFLPYWLVLKLSVNQTFYLRVFIEKQEHNILKFYCCRLLGSCWFYNKWIDLKSFFICRGFLFLFFLHPGVSEMSRLHQDNVWICILLLCSTCNHIQWSEVNNFMGKKLISTSLFFVWFPFLFCFMYAYLRRWNLFAYRYNMFCLFFIFSIKMWF